MDMRVESDRRSCAVGLEGRVGQAYNEAAFRHFLTIERVRFERSGCPFLLLLATLDDQQGVTGALDRQLAATVFSAFRLCLRETDFVGWFREDRVAGAVLTEISGRPPVEVSRLVGERVRKAVGDRLSGDAVGRLGVHLYIGEPASVVWPICDGDDLALGAERHLAPARATAQLVFHPESHGLPRPIR